jgi:hypothetical protein
MLTRMFRSGNSLAEVAQAFAAFPAGFMSEGREFHEQTERNWESAPSRCAGPPDCRSCCESGCNPRNQ